MPSLFGDAQRRRPWPLDHSPSPNPNSPTRRHRGVVSNCRIAAYSAGLDVVAGCCILGSPLGKLRCRAARGQVPAQHAADARRSLALWHTSLFCAAVVCGAGERRRRCKDVVRIELPSLALVYPNYNGVALVVKKVGLTGVATLTPFADCDVEPTPTPVWLARLCAEHA
jgi:hypothetical protein